MTPSFKRWATNPNLFIQHALRKIFSSSVTGDSELIINSTVAVVDGIPEPNESTIDAASTEPNDDRPAKARNLDGVSFMLMGVGLRFRTCRQHTLDLMHDDCGDADNTLTIYTSGYSETEKMRKSGNLQTFTSAIQVPLTITTFRDGLSATVLSYNWRLLGRKDLRLTARRKIKSTKLYWPSVPELTAGKRHLSLSTSLYPLTYPRIVKSSMGNIIRSVSKTFPSEGEMKQESIDENDENSFPASKELEQAIGAFFTSEAIDPNNANVWALIVPQNVYKHEIHLWENVTMINSGLSQNQISQNTQERYANDRLIFRLIEKGARLHRVMSGGGGWGNRAGLLSLDPEYSFGTQKEITLEEFSLSKGIFPSVANPGSIVQFFIRLNDNNITSKDDSNVGDLSLDHPFPMGSFEVLNDATVDNGASQSASKADDSIPALKSYNSYFGASSGKGLGIGLRQWEKNISHSIARKIWKTKLDVPGSKISIKVNEKHGWTPEEYRSRVLFRNLPDENVTFEKKLDKLKKYKLSLSSDESSPRLAAGQHDEDSSAEGFPGVAPNAKTNLEHLETSAKRPQTIEGNHMQPSTPDDSPRNITSAREQVQNSFPEKQHPLRSSRRRILFKKHYAIDKPLEAYNGAKENSNIKMRYVKTEGKEYSGDGKPGKPGRRQTRYKRIKF